MDKEKLFRFFFGTGTDVFPEKVVISPVIPLRRFAANCGVASEFTGRFFSGFVSRGTNGKAIAVIRTGIGSAMTGDAVRLLGECGVRELVFAGFCGSLGDLHVGDILLCDEAYDGEGFTRYHTGALAVDEGTIVRGSAEYVALAERYIKENCGKAMHIGKGRVYTIGSILAETPELLTGLAGSGFAGIDMEVSAVYAAAAFTGMKAIGLLVVSDAPPERPFWQEKDVNDHKRFSEGIEEAVKLSVGFVGKR
ncbi:MAG: hypothetical protein PHH49_02245 [Candidatus Omnitrophica bacterium]|nr:hypothetical protein [Candidatus Omnitrophota bacterium]MDD5487767.1 hypothetical protein [Candidatus Omnitrophota bacterium]